MQVSSCWIRRLAREAATFKLITFILAVLGLYPGLTSAGSQWVSTEVLFRKALADVATDTIYLASSLNLTGSDSIVVARSVRILGKCSDSAPSTPGCTLASDSNGGSFHVLHIRNEGREISVHIEGFHFRGLQGANQGAIACSGAQSSKVVVEGSSFHEFISEEGSAFLITGTGCTVTCKSCDFINNEAASTGGAVHIHYGWFTCHQCNFSGNRAQKGGAVYVTMGSQVELSFPSFAQNVATMGGPDIFIENLPFATLSFCPASPHPDTTGSPRAPMEISACATAPPTAEEPPPQHEVASNASTSDLPSVTPGPGTGIIQAPQPPLVPDTNTPSSEAATNLTGSLTAALSPSFLEGVLPSNSSGLYLYTMWGASQVPAGASFGLVGILASGAQGAEDAALNITAGRWEGPAGGCSGFLLQRAVPSQGSCGLMDNATACSVACGLGQVLPSKLVFLDLTLRAVTVGAVLALGASVQLSGQQAVALPVHVTDTFGVEAEPIRVIDALQPLIAPAPGEGGVRRLAGGPHARAFFAGAAEVLRFMVMGPALGRCNLTGAILVDGVGQVANVTAGRCHGELMTFEVVAVPDSAMVLRVAAGACSSADGQASLASEGFPLLIDVSRPSATVSSVSVRRTKEDLAVFHIQFSEWVSGFSEDGVKVEGGKLTCLSFVNETKGTYEAIIRPEQGASTVLLSVKDGAAVDVAGNGCTASDVASSRCDFLSPLGEALSVPLQFLAGVSLLMSLTGKGSSRPVAFIGHLQFFQMFSALDVPLGGFLEDAFLKLAWVNNAWPRPMFGMGGETQDVTSGSIAPHLFFPSNGSCQGQGDKGVMTSGNGTLTRRMLDDATGGEWATRTLDELGAVLQAAHPSVPTYAAIPGTRRVGHLSSQGDVGAIVLLCLCQLAACLAVQATCAVLWRVIHRLHPSVWWEAKPASLLFPRLELLVLLLTLPTVTQASVYYATAGFDWGVLIGLCVGAAYPLAFVTFVAYFLAANILWSDRCIFRRQRVYFLQGSLDPNCSPTRRHSDNDELSISSGGSSLRSVLGVSPASYKKPYLLAASWLDRGMTLKGNYVQQYGLVFQDLKGPTRTNDASNASSDTGTPSSPLHLPGGMMTCQTNLYVRSSITRQETPLEEWLPRRSGFFPSRKLMHALAVGGTGITWGHLAVSYALVSAFKQVAFAALTGISSQHLGLSRLGWFQVSAMLIWLVFHVGYIILVQPFISQLRNTLEMVITLCELGSLACCLLLLITHPGESSSLQGILSAVILFSFFLAAGTSLFALASGLPQAARKCWRAVHGKLPPWLHESCGTSEMASRRATAQLASGSSPWGLSTSEGSSRGATRRTTRNPPSRQRRAISESSAESRSGASASARRGLFCVGHSLESRRPANPAVPAAPEGFLAVPLPRQERWRTSELRQQARAGTRAAGGSLLVDGTKQTDRVMDGTSDKYLADYNDDTNSNDNAHRFTKSKTMGRAAAGGPMASCPGADAVDTGQGMATGAALIQTWSSSYRQFRRSCSSPLGPLAEWPGMDTGGTTPGGGMLGAGGATLAAAPGEDMVPAAPLQMVAAAPCVGPRANATMNLGKGGEMGDGGPDNIEDKNRSSNDDLTGASSHMSWGAGGEFGPSCTPTAKSHGNSPNESPGGSPRHAGGPKSSLQASLNGSSYAMGPRGVTISRSTNSLPLRRSMENQHARRSLDGAQYPRRASLSIEVSVEAWALAQGQESPPGKGSRSPGPNSPGSVSEGSGNSGKSLLSRTSPMSHEKKTDPAREGGGSEVEDRSPSGGWWRRAASAVQDSTTGRNRVHRLSSSSREGDVEAGEACPTSGAI